MKQDKLQDMVDEAVEPVYQKPKYHAFLHYPDGEVKEVEGNLIRVREGAVEVVNGKQIEAYPVASLRGYTINQP